MSKLHNCTQCGGKHPSGLCWQLTDGEIYIITCFATGRHYVGKANRKRNHKRNVRAKALGRYKEHWQLARGGKVGDLYSDMRKYGPDAFRMRVVDSASNLAELNEKEARWVAALNAANPQQLYNRERHLHADY